MKKRDLVGQKFNRWTVIEEAEKKNKELRWLCKCECGTMKSVDGSQLKKGKSKSCGCLAKEINIKRRKKDLAGRTFGKLEVIKENGKNDHGKTLWECRCECGETVNIHTSALTGGSRKSCGCNKKDKRYSTKFAGKRFGRLLVMSDSKERASSEILWFCRCDCGKRTKVRTSSLKRGFTKSCGCLNKEIIRENIKKLHQNMKGENHPQYNPDKTDEERLMGRYVIGDSIVKWRNEVYKRNNYTCQSCYSIGGRLNAHHLDGWNWCKEQRFNVENGVTLCEDCHNDFHKVYGRGNNTKQQFEEFKQAKKNNEQLALSL
jgi:hypothetical protein